VIDGIDSNGCVLSAAKEAANSTIESKTSKSCGNCEFTAERHSIAAVSNTAMVIHFMILVGTWKPPFSPCVHSSLPNNSAGGLGRSQRETAQPRAKIGAAIL
jgi:hypothetical protein